MPYSSDKPPQWSKKKSKAVQKVAIDVFNETFDKTGSESKARRASLAAQKNAEESFSKSKLIQKSLNEEKRLATFVVLEPQDNDGTTTDLHSDWYDAETVEQACHNFNRYCRKANLLHAMPTTCYEFIESYIQKADCIIGDQFIKNGTWVATIYVDESPSGNEVWDGIKSGYFNGLSIQCAGQVEEI